MIKIHTLGGYNEVGKNMTAVEFNDDIIVFDCGLHIPAIVDLQESVRQPTPKMYEDAGALPDYSFLEKNKNKVRAFLVSHAHLDHVGAIHYVARKFPNAIVCGTPFTIEVLKTIMEDSKLFLKNKIKVIQPDGQVIIKGKNQQFKADFVNITHSTIQASIIALHSKEGIVVYANDFKLDNSPIMGNPPNYKKMKELGKKGVSVLIMDALYSGEERKTHSEKIARAMVEEVMLTIDHKNKGIIISTFSSHIARLKSIVDFSKKLNRKVIFVGRSLSKYVNAAKKINQCPFYKDIEIASYSKQVESKLKKINQNRGNYVMVCTGHQAEPGSVLDRLVSGKLPFSFNPQDSVIFSSKVIPAPVNVANRANMDKKIKQNDVRLFDNVHVSGHPGREDLRDMVNLFKPKHLIPSHGGLDKTTPAMELFKEMGYLFGKTAHLCQDGQVIIIN
ncbi:MAG: MBL fold metallo-hydrolase [Nanoarchaeota archaeon]|nr:MBL fold metallo-hydrolase [Nanoarchaeota archaeon]